MENSIRGLRRLTLKSDKTLSEEQKTSLIQLIEIYKIQKKHLAGLDDKVQALKSEVNYLKDREALYENCIADMADEINGDKEEFIVGSFKNKWNL